MSRSSKPQDQRATERVAVLMTAAEKSEYTNQASSMGLSLGQFFREAGAAYVSSASTKNAPEEALEAALKQLELSTAKAEAALDQALKEVRAALGRSS
jgi:hypothetical protein